MAFGAIDPGIKIGNSNPGGAMIVMELSREEQKAFDRYRQIINLLLEMNDRRGLKLISELINKANSYIRTVTQIETHIKILELKDVSSEEYRTSVSNMDRNRKIAHNVLMSQLTIVNRYLFKHEKLQGKIPLGGIYSLEPQSIDNREAVGDWAHYLIRALVLNGII